MFQSPNNTSIINAVPSQKMGVAGSINSLVRNLGMVTGIAFSVTLFEGLGGSAAPQLRKSPAFMSAYQAVMLVAMGIALIGVIISLSRRAIWRQLSVHPKADSQKGLTNQIRKRLIRMRQVHRRLIHIQFI